MPPAPVDVATAGRLRLQGGGLRPSLLRQRGPCASAGACGRWCRASCSKERRGVRAAGLLQLPLPGPARRPGSCPTAKPNQVIVSTAHSALFDEGAGRRHNSRAAASGRLVRQPGARRARRRPAAGRHHHAADHAARGEHHARVAPAPGLAARHGGGAVAHRRTGRDLNRAGPSGPLQADGPRSPAERRRSLSPSGHVLGRQRHHGRCRRAGDEAARSFWTSLAVALAISPSAGRSLAPASARAPRPRRSPRAAPGATHPHHHGRGARRPAKRLASNTCTSLSLARVQQRRGLARMALSPMRSSARAAPATGHPLRSARQASTSSFSFATQASAAASMFCGCACG